jgi:WD40 repeat protein
MWEISFQHAGEHPRLQIVKNKFPSPGAETLQSAILPQAPGQWVITGAGVQEINEERESLERERGAWLPYQRISKLRKYVFRFQSNSLDGIYRYYTTKRGKSMTCGHVLIRSKGPIKPVPFKTESDDGSVTYREFEYCSSNSFRESMLNAPVQADADLIDYETDTVPELGDGSICEWGVHGTRFPIQSMKKSLRFRETTIPLEHVRRSNTGDRYAASGWNGRCIVYRPGEMNRAAELDPLSNGEDVLLLRGHKGAVTHACWSPDDRFIATCSVDYTVRIWNSRTGRQMLILKSHFGFVRAVEWASYGAGKHYIASGGDDGRVRVWDVSNFVKNNEHDFMQAETGADANQEEATIVYRPPARKKDQILSLAWKPGGRMLAIGWHTNPVEIITCGRYDGLDQWESLLSLHPRVKNFPNDKHQMQSWEIDDVRHTHGMAWSPDGQYLATAGGGLPKPNKRNQKNVLVSVWQVLSQKLMCCADNIFSMQIWGLSWSPDGKKIAVCSQDGDAVVFIYEKMLHASLNMNVIASSRVSLEERKRRYAAMLKLSSE